MTEPPGRSGRPTKIDAGMLHWDVDFEKGMSPFPWVTLLMIVLCTAAFVCQMASGALDNLQDLVEAGALASEPVHDGQLWRLVSATFLH